MRELIVGRLREQDRLVSALVACALAACATPAEPAPVAQPPVATPAECSHESDRGYERVHEVSRDGDVCVLRVETNHYGGALGGAIFGMQCIVGLCQRDGYAGYVILHSHIVRLGSDEAPGNDWELVLGLLRDEHADPAAIFPDHARPGLRVWPARMPDDTSSMSAVFEDMYPSELWDVFSSIHFHWREPPEGT